jgi:AcrR family transcriptional regulator
MVRPSQFQDQLLLDAGLALLPVTGCAGLSVRRVAEHAGVNLGMFHYHFKTRENFIKAVLQRTYEEMFSELTLHIHTERSPLENLRDTLGVIAGFGLKNGRLLVRILADALSGEVLAVDFLQANLPRHMTVIASLVQQAQQDGSLRTTPLPQAVAFLVGAIVAPLLAATALQQQAVASNASALLLKPEAITERITFALRGMAA